MLGETNLNTWLDANQFVYPFADIFSDLMASQELNAVLFGDAVRLTSVLLLKRTSKILRLLSLKFAKPICGQNGSRICFNTSFNQCRHNIVPIYIFLDNTTDFWTTPYILSSDYT